MAEVDPAFVIDRLQRRIAQDALEIAARDARIADLEAQVQQLAADVAVYEQPRVPLTPAEEATADVIAQGPLLDGPVLESVG